MRVGRHTQAQTHLFEPGDYGRGEDGFWYCRPPADPAVNLLGFLKNHKVIEHEDGTISVDPSILVTNGRGATWHGYLKRGVWDEC